jgi:hypothetical protein
MGKSKGAATEPGALFRRMQRLHVPRRAFRPALRPVRRGNSPTGLLSPQAAHIFTAVFSSFGMFPHPISLSVYHGEPDAAD